MGRGGAVPPKSDATFFVVNIWSAKRRLYCTPLADKIFEEMFDGLPRIFRLFSLRNLIKLNQRSDFESRKQQM